MKKDTDLNKIKHFHIDTSTCNILNSSHNIKTFYCENVKKKKRKKRKKKKKSTQDVDLLLFFLKRQFGLEVKRCSKELGKDGKVQKKKNQRRGSFCKPFYVQSLTKDSGYMQMMNNISVGPKIFTSMKQISKVNKILIIEPTGL